ncbi:MAG: hypothetical protein IPG02_18245 [Ignavibacteria bacterium]|nr:hypothetical protein [Ignavibacteria bacterium]MBK6878257.1 hypothetical protein [Ignavibacteria bacterium]MBK9228010.1 hypothetical protein [Ignavibacteria bacterium]
MKKSIIALITLLMFCGIARSQDGILVENPQYGVKFNVPNSWKERKVEETSKKDAISYSFDKNDGSIAMMLIAFRLSEVKNLNDLVYTLEKDLTLNIPKIDGTYSEFDKGNYDGMSAKYKDTEFTEIIYYFRTKYSEGVNYAYMLRFITSTTVFSPSIDEEIKKIGDAFEPLPGQ